MHDINDSIRGSRTAKDENTNLLVEKRQQGEIDAANAGKTTGQTWPGKEDIGPESAKGAFSLLEKPENMKSQSPPSIFEKLQGRIMKTLSDLRKGFTLRLPKLSLGRARQSGPASEPASTRTDARTRRAPVHLSPAEDNAIVASLFGSHMVDAYGEDAARGIMGLDPVPTEAHSVESRNPYPARNDYIDHLATSWSNDASVQLDGRPQNELEKIQSQELPGVSRHGLEALTLNSHYKFTEREISDLVTRTFNSRHTQGLDVAPRELLGEIYRTAIFSGLDRAQTNNLVRSAYRAATGQEALPFNLREDGMLLSTFTRANKIAHPARQEAMRAVGFRPR